jgi:RNA-directed DNA polymerase
MWRQWKTPRRRRAALSELGVRPRLACNTAGSGLGPWYLAKAKALSVGLSNAYFKSLGLPSLFESVSGTDSNRRERTRTHGGVAGVGG